MNILLELTKPKNYIGKMEIGDTRKQDPHMREKVFANFTAKLRAI
jgi:hypothetical protein